MVGYGWVGGRTKYSVSLVVPGFDERARRVQSSCCSTFRVMWTVEALCGEQTSGAKFNDAWVEERARPCASAVFSRTCVPYLLGGRLSTRVPPLSLCVSWS